MKNKKTTLRMETLEDRNMLSASPAGLAAPAPVPTSGDALSYNFGSIEGAAGAVQGSVGTVQGLLDAADTAADADLYVRFGSRPVLAYGYPSIATHVHEHQQGLAALKDLSDSLAVPSLPSMGNLASTMGQLSQLSGGMGGLQQVGQATSGRSGVINNVFTPWTAEVAMSDALFSPGDQGEGFTVIVVTDHGHLNAEMQTDAQALSAQMQAGSDGYQQT